MTNDLDILGDVHLERRFRTGVPLHRIGDREAMVWKQFEDSVMNTTALCHVQTGDLFNEFAVSEATVLRAAAIYREAAYKNPATMYIVYRGNHDASRDGDKKSSFDVFKELMQDIDNVEVLIEPTILQCQDQIYGFLPWHPFKSSTELAMELLNHMIPGEDFTAVFCHCDVKSYGGEDHNLIPVNVLKHHTKLIYTGHIHRPEEFEQDGVKVVVVGSMQPYAHGEDPGTDWYETVSYHAITQMITLSMFKDKNIRVLVESNDQIVPEFDCLSCITKKVDAKAIEDDSEQVVMEEFDMMALFRLSLKENNVGADVSEKILSRFQEKKHG